MEKLTTLLNDVLEGFRKLHVLVLLIRIGPNEMETINKHGAYNTSAIAVLALLFLVSINLYSPSYNIGIVTSGVAAILSAVLIGLIGFFVNFAAPADEVFSDDTIEASARSRTDKWATYFIINLILLALVFITINAGATFFTGSILVNVLMQYGILDYNGAVFFQVAAASLAATSMVFLLCWKSNKFKSDLKYSILLFVLTNTVCAILFYVINYRLFT